jgi:hypothetical protein
VSKKLVMGVALQRLLKDDHRGLSVSDITTDVVALLRETEAKIAIRVGQNPSEVDRRDAVRLQSAIAAFQRELGVADG